jgi:type IV pilus assembly protein PilC
MINAGVPIVQALSILSAQTESKQLKTVVGEVSKQVEGGSTLANALSVHPEIFNDIYVNMVRAGETGGILDEVLDRLATQQEKDAEVVSKIRSAMIYPGVITAATIGAFFFLMTSIVPKLASIFTESSIALPWYTVLMLTISKILTHYYFFVIGGFIGLIIFADGLRHFGA